VSRSPCYDVAGAWTAATVRKSLDFDDDFDADELGLDPEMKGATWQDWRRPIVHGTDQCIRHTDRDGDRWNCNSTLLHDMPTDPPDKDGPPIILEGLELEREAVMPPVHMVHSDDSESARTESPSGWQSKYVPWRALSCS